MSWVFVAVVTIPTEEVLSLPLVSFFSDVYEICVAHPEPLADRLYLETKTFLENHVQTLLEERVLIGDSQNASNEQSAGTGSSSASPYLLLERYYDVWMEYSSGSQYLNHLYL